MKVSVGSIASKKKIKFITAHNGKLGFNYHNRWNKRLLLVNGHIV